MTTQGRQPHQRPSVARLDPVREQRQQARDFNNTVAVPPELVDLIGTMQGQIADQARMLAAQEARIAALEARPADDEDGQPSASGRWCRMKEAMSLTHYSRSGLLALCRRRRVRFDFEGAHRIIDVNSVPRKTSSATVQSEQSK
jgi:hypothetical protein